MSATLLPPNPLSLPDSAFRPVKPNTAATVQGAHAKGRFREWLEGRKTQAFYDSQILANVFTAASGMATGTWGRAATGTGNVLSNIFYGAMTKLGLKNDFNTYATQSGLMAFGAARQAPQGYTAATGFELGAVSMVMTAYGIKSLCSLRRYIKDRNRQNNEISQNNTEFSGTAVTTTNIRQGVEPDRWQRAEDFVLQQGDNLFTALFIARGALQIADAGARWMQGEPIDGNALAGGLFYINSALLERTQRKALENTTRNEPSTQPQPS